MHQKLPPHAELQKPTLDAIRKLGGEATNSEIDTEVARALALSPEALALVHGNGERGRTEFAYRMAWARTHLKADGKITRAGPRRWRLVQ